MEEETGNLEVLPSLLPIRTDLEPSTTVTEGEDEEVPITLAPVATCPEVKMEEVKIPQGVIISTPTVKEAPAVHVSTIRTRTSSGARAKVSFKDVHSGGGVRTRSSLSPSTNLDTCAPSVSAVKKPSLGPCAPLVPAVKKPSLDSGTGVPSVPAVKKSRKRTYPKKKGGSKSKKAKKVVEPESHPEEITDASVDQPVASVEVESKESTDLSAEVEENSMPKDLDKHVTLTGTDEPGSEVKNILNDAECPRLLPVLDQMVFKEPTPTEGFLSPSALTNVACTTSPQEKGKQLELSSLKSLTSEITSTAKPSDLLSEVVSEELDGDEDDDDNVLLQQKECGNGSDEPVTGGDQRLSPVLSSSAAGSCSEADAEVAKPKRKKAKGRNGNIYIGVSNRIEWFKLQEKFGFENVNNFGNFVMAYMHKVFSDFDILHKVTLETGMFEEQGLEGFRWVNGLAHPVNAAGEFLTLPEVQMDEAMSQKAFQMAFDLAVERSAFLVELSNQVSSQPQGSSGPPLTAEIPTVQEQEAPVKEEECPEKSDALIVHKEEECPEKSGALIVHREEECPEKSGALIVHKEEDEKQENLSTEDLKGVEDTVIISTNVEAGDASQVPEQSEVILTDQDEVTNSGISCTSSISLPIIESLSL